eukprot:TRINITY_DN19753_c0_g1_i1.p1 TRINITY_DN19753_c0_g1~~TRINITY_DN19753_c0_g1_i1.p1  ORF type:complete len:372 (-),score=90.87 TRINITY_DN19753_c0_g1_i1:862-1977(-)
MSWDQQYTTGNDYQYDMYSQYGSDKDGNNVNQQQTYYNPNDYMTQPTPNSYNGGGFSQPEGGGGGAQVAGGQQQQYYGGPPGAANYGGYPGQAAMYPPGQQAAGPGGPQFMMPGSTMLQDPMVTNLAMSYGRDFVGKGQEEIKRNLDKWVSISQLKYYFAVDTTYVTKKLSLILFPYVQKDWSIRYSHDEPVQPRFELNAADLYIPSMAFVTYILVVGYMLGVQDRFSPEKLASTASGALTALFLEIIIIYLTTTVMSISSTLAKWDFLAFSMYKYVNMILCLLAGLLLSRTGYYASLLYSSASLALFLFRTLHLRIEPEVHGGENHGKRKLWLISLMVALQPLIMWWLTYSLVPTTTPMETQLPNASNDF